MHIRKGLILMLVPLAVAASVFAKEGKNIMLQRDAILAGNHLASGSYNITWQAHNPSATVSFEQKGKVVATAEGKIVEQPQKCPSNEVFYGMAANGSSEIKQIRFRGSTQIIVFSE